MWFFLKEPLYLHFHDFLLKVKEFFLLRKHFQTSRHYQEFQTVYSLLLLFIIFLMNLFHLGWTGTESNNPNIILRNANLGIFYYFAQIKMKKNIFSASNK